MKRNKIAAVSYNSIGNWQKGVREFPDGTAHIYPGAFRMNGAKGKENVLEDDPVFLELVKEDDLHPFDLVLVFFGKESSGGVAMIDDAIFCHPRFVGRVMFVVCGHDKEEKFAAFRNHGIDPDTDPMVFCFEDNFFPCREAYILVGMIVVMLGG